MNRWLKSFILSGLSLFLEPNPILAQDNTYQKDGTLLYSIGIGYQRISDAYSPKGLALDVRARFYSSEQLFYELMGHWGTHNGNKDVMQKGSIFSIHDERDCFLAALGPGYEFFHSENKLFDVYVKGLIGYGVRRSRYDEYQPIDANDGTITLGREKNKKSIAAVVGIGSDARFKNWALSPSVEFIYVSRKCDVALMVSIGLFY